MRIEPKTITPIDTRTTSNDAPPTRPSPHPADSAAVVHLSDAAAAVSHDHTEPAITARIGRIQALLAEGAYPIDLDRLADKIVTDEAERTRGGR